MDDLLLYRKIMRLNLIGLFLVFLIAIDLSGFWGWLAKLMVLTLAVFNGIALLYLFKKDFKQVPKPTDPDRFRTRQL